MIYVSYLYSIYINAVDNQKSPLCQHGFRALLEVNRIINFPYLTEHLFVAVNSSSEPTLY